MKKLYHHSKAILLDISEEMDSWLDDNMSQVRISIKNTKFRHEFKRRVAWYGDEGVNYVYSGGNHVAKGWPDVIRDMANKISSICKEDVKFNHVLVNKYTYGQGLGWHMDDEPELQGPIASVTLGDPAMFWYGRSGGSVELGHKKVIIGNREFWDTTYHKAGSPLETDGIRFNLTFRHVTS